jgi:hypothetical protein
MPSVSLGSTSYNVTVGYVPSLKVVQEAEGLQGPRGETLWSEANAGIYTTRNVGVGTTPNSNALLVNGNSYFNGNGYFTGVVTATSFVGAVIPDVGEENVIYVAKDGNDSNIGNLASPKLTIKGAVGAATSNTVIRVAPGSYIEDNPIILPDEVSVMGHSLRETTVQPLNSDQDLFHLGNANYVAEMSFSGSLPGKAIFAFDPNNQRYINRSPYVQNCTNFIPNSIGMRIDGRDATGPIKSMVLDSYTQYNQGGIGISITNEAYAQLVSLFTICDDIAVYCGSGGACDLTNSNSSFGNYGLVADGVSGKKYTGIVTVAAAKQSDSFVVNLATPTLSISTAYYDNTTGILTAYTTVPHKFSVGMGISLSSLQFTCAGVGGIATYPNGSFGYIFDAETVAPGRYVDSYNLIQANRREIQDKSLASVAIAHSDFYFPGDSQTNSRSRYYDAYRLIQNNRDVIVGTAWTNTYNVYPGISTTMVKCKRDLGYFVDAISTDVFTGGNKYAREFTLQYFNNGVPISNGLVGEVTESIYAFHQARELMKNAITNSLVGAAYSDLTITTGPGTYNGVGPIYSNTDPLACADVRSNIDNLVGIVTTILNAGNITSLPTENLGTFTTGGNKCFRDIGYLIDAVSLDVRDYTNQNIRNFIKGYFDANGNPITNGLTGELTESATAFNAVRDYSKKAITNQLNSKDLTIAADPVTGFNTDPASCSDVRSFIDNLVGTVNSNSVGIGTTVLNLPSVSMASTVFTCNVGVSTTPNQVYVGGGTANINVVRPYDGQVIYFNELFYTVKRLIIVNEGSGYTSRPTITIQSPDTSWGIKAQAAPIIEGQKLVSADMISNGRGYKIPPTVTVTGPQVGINTAVVIAEIVPEYYTISKATPISGDISIITLNENVPFDVGVGTEVSFFKQSRILASGHSFEFIGSGTDIASCLPFSGGSPPIPENETDARNGGLVVYTSTNQAGNFQIGDGVIVNQNTGTISGVFYAKSLLSTVTPYILSLGGF